MPVQLGDYVRFRACKAYEVMKERERDLGVVVALVSETSLELWPVVQFDGYRSAALQPGMVEIVGEAGSARDESKAVNLSGSRGA